MRKVAKTAFVAIFLLGFFLRVASIYPNNMIFGFDQARDLFNSYSIFLNRDLKIIGPTAGNNLALHHGVAYLYYILPALILFRGSPVAAAVFNGFVNLLGGIVLFFFARSLFKSDKAGLIAFFLGATSYYFVEFSGWLSNPSPTLFTVPLFFLGLWEYYRGKEYGLYLSSFFLGLSIQFELFFLYLIPTAVLVWLVLRIKLPRIKAVFFSLSLFLISTSTMVATEIKYKFAGELALMNSVFGSGKGGTFLKYFSDFWERYFLTFSQNVLPLNSHESVFLTLLIFSVVFFGLMKKKNIGTKDSYIFLLIYLLSPLILYVFGYHLAPWYLIGLSPAIILGATLVILKIRSNFLMISIILLIFVENCLAILGTSGLGNNLLEPDSSAIMSNQISVIDYTYKSSEGTFFTINSVTNPLYINAVWAYLYKWYGLNKYGYMPTWSGGIQLEPYNVLAKARGNENNLYLIIDSTPRIPDEYKLSAEKWAEERGNLIEERKLGGLVVQKWSLRIR